MVSISINLQGKSQVYLSAQQDLKNIMKTRPNGNRKNKSDGQVKSYVDLMFHLSETLLVMELANLKC